MPSEAAQCGRYQLPSGRQLENLAIAHSPVSVLLFCSATSVMSCTLL